MAAAGVVPAAAGAAVEAAVVPAPGAVVVVAGASVVGAVVPAAGAVVAAVEGCCAEMAD